MSDIYLNEIVAKNSQANMSLTLKPGQVFIMSPRYDGGGRYAADNGFGQLIRLMRPMKDGLDWYVTRNLDDELEDCSWDYIVSEGRIMASELVQEFE
jgi:hypothetical protein